MARDTTASFDAELAKTVKSPVIFYEGEFQGVTVRFHSGVGSLSWNGETWTGAGDLGRISTVEESAEVKANGVTVGLNGLKSSLLSNALQNARRSKPCRMWLGFLDAAGAVVSDPYLVFRGFLDQPKLKPSAEDKAELSINYENRLVRLQKPNIRRWTHEDQRSDFPTDKGFEFVPRANEWNGKWGS